MKSDRIAPRRPACVGEGPDPGFVFRAVLQSIDRELSGLVIALDIVRDPRPAGPPPRSGASRSRECRPVADSFTAREPAWP